MTDPRLERLRQLDAAATDPPWAYPQLNGSDADGSAASTARNILPATIELIALVLAYHRQNANGNCVSCDVAYPCQEAWHALAVLDRSGADDD